MLQRALEDAGLTMADINAYDMDTSNMVTAMVSGTLDACSTWSPNTWQILNELDDAKKLCSPMDYIDKAVALSSFVVMEKWADENHDVLVRFTRALMKAMDYGAKEENLTQVSEWIATQLAADVATVEAQDHDGNWLTGEELYAAVQDGTIKGYYQTPVSYTHLDVYKRQGYSGGYKHCSTGITHWRSIATHHVPDVMHRKDFTPVSSHSLMRSKFDEIGMHMEKKMGHPFFCCDAVLDTWSRQIEINSGYAAVRCV